MLREGMKVSINAMEARVAEVRAVISTIEPQSVDVVAAEPVAEQSKAVEATKSEDGEVWHTVSDGELLGRIVRSYGTTIAEVKRLNPNINVDRLSIGQRILISCGGEAAPKVESVAPKVVEGDDEVWYTLEKGDLVGRVAQRFGTTSKRIAELNPDINIDRVRDGQRIRIK
jgi:LysM repeat protein